VLFNQTEISRFKGLSGTASDGIITLDCNISGDAQEIFVKKTYDKVRNLLTAFQNQYDCINCIDLTGCDLIIDYERKRWEGSEPASKC